MGNPSDQVRAEGAWRDAFFAQARALRARFHVHAPTGTAEQEVESAIVDLVSEYLWLDLGLRASFETFDVAHFRSVALPTVLDTSYRIRLRDTLVRFYDFLADVGAVTPGAAVRTQDELESRFADEASGVTHYESFVRYNGQAGAAGDVVHDVVAPLSLVRRG